MNKEIKEKLLKELDDVNHKLYYDVMGGDADCDSIGMDSHHLFRAKRYVPNKVIKEWIKEIKEQLKIWIKK